MTTLPAHQKETRKRGGLKRRLFLLLTSLTLAYPLFSFLGYKAIKKPKIVKLQLDLKPGKYHIEPDFILFEGNHQPWAVSRKCTHLGCIIQFREQERVFECPCHQSRFSEQGIVLNGPAKRNLGKYHVEKLNEQKVYLVTM